MDKRSIAGAGMAYSEKKKAYNEEYTRTHFKQIMLRLQSDYFDETVKPAADAAGEQITVFIKKAIAERIERLNQ